MTHGAQYAGTKQQLLLRHAHQHRVYVVDDEPVFRIGLKQLISQIPQLTVCGESDGSNHALSEIINLRPDLVTTPVHLNQSDGLDFIKQIRQSSPSTCILVISRYDEKIYAERVIHAGASGYVMKHVLPDTLVDAIHTVLKNDVFFSRAVTTRIIKQSCGHAQPVAVDSVRTLSDRELSTFQLIGQGYSTQHLAKKLFVSPKTIESYRTRIKLKLGLHTAFELRKMAIEWTKNNGV